MIPRKRIDIGKNDAFNASWIDTRFGRLLIYRYGTEGDHGSTSLHYCFLDEDWDVLNNHHNLLLKECQDPRFVEHAGELYIAVCHKVVLDGSFRYQMGLHSLSVMDEKVVTARRIGLFDGIGNWAGYKRGDRERNWIPFSNDGHMYMIYSVNPHRILEVDVKTGAVSLVYSSEYRDCAWPKKYGEVLRLSTNVVLMNDGTYLGSFHTRFMTRNPHPPSHYYTGFYRFSRNPPFEVLEVSKQPLILPTDCYKPNTRFNCMDLAVFPLKLEVNEGQGVVRVVGGDSDHYVVAIDMPLKDVVGSLVPVSR